MVYNRNMIRTQIYLPKSQQDLLKQEARSSNTTVSNVIRKLVHEGLVEKKTTKRTQKNSPGLLAAAKEIAKLREKGPSDLATNLDDYLYGGKK